MVYPFGRGVFEIGTTIKLLRLVLINSGFGGRTPNSPPRLPELVKAFLILIVYGNLKTVNIMANVRLKFYGNGESKNHNLECFANTNRKIYIQIDMEDSVISPSWICLDVPTAIKLSKVLRQSINQIKAPF